MPQDLLLFSLFILIASISPGPNVLITVINSMKVGWIKAYWTILGNLAALFMIAMAAALGVGALLVKSHVLFSMLKIFGGLYLIYMGVKLWKNRKNPVAINATGKEARSRRQLFMDGFSVSLSNPKAVVFLASVFPQFIDAEAALVPQFTAMFAVIICIVGLVHGTYGLFASRVVRAAKSNAVYARINSVSSTVFCGFGVALAAEGASSLKN